MHWSQLIHAPLATSLAGSKKLHRDGNQCFPLSLRTDSAMIPTWDHIITIAAVGSGTLYRDRVTIRAGLLTPAVWLFALLFYHHRQRRWRQLVRNGFDYGTQ